MITDREQQIIDAIQADPMLSQQQLADNIGISRSAIATHMTNLTAKGIIKGRGYVLATEQFSVVIGGANIDIAGAPEAKIVAQTSNPGAVSISAGGVARNVAENVARLNNKCYLIAAVGDDSNGKFLCDSTHSAGVDISQMLTLKDSSTSSYLSIVDEQGEMQLAIADMSIVDQLSIEHLKRQTSLLKQASIIMLDTNISVELMAFLFTQLPDSRFFVDTVSIAKSAKIRDFLPHIHSLKPNLLEAQSLSGIKVDNYQQLPELANWFHQEGVKQVFISLGKDGLYYSDQNIQQHIQLPAQQVLNSNGAGDALTAALIHAHLANMPAIDGCYFALAAANLTLATTATNNPSLSEHSVINLLKESQC